LLSFCSGVILPLQECHNEQKELGNDYSLPPGNAQKRKAMWILAVPQNIPERLERLPVM
jgi:hypothetical protein